MFASRICGHVPLSLASSTPRLALLITSVSSVASFIGYVRVSCVHRNNNEKKNIKQSTFPNDMAISNQCNLTVQKMKKKPNQHETFFNLDFCRSARCLFWLVCAEIRSMSSGVSVTKFAYMSTVCVCVDRFAVIPISACAKNDLLLAFL